MNEIYSKFFNSLEIGDEFPTVIMGVLNLSPESFYKGSVYEESEALIRTTAKPKVISTLTKETTNQSRENSTVAKPNTQVIRKTLLIPSEVKIKNTTVNRLILRKSKDIVNFNKIVNMTRTIKIDANKEIFINEILRMDKTFVNEYSKRANDNQTNEYISIIKNKTPINIDIKDTQISNLFNQKIDIDKFIEQIWK